MKGKKIKDNVLYLYLISLGISAVALFLSSFVMSLIAYSSADSTKNIGLFSLVALIASAVVSGIVLTRIKGEGGVKFAGLISLALMLILLLIAVISCKGAVPPSAFMNYGCYIGVSMLSAYLGRKRNGSRRKRKR